MKPTAALATLDQFKERLVQLVLDALPSPTSKRAYGKAIRDFLAWLDRERPAGGFNKAAVQAYRAALIDRNLSPATVNMQLSAIRRLAIEAADSRFIPQTAAAAIARVSGVRNAGVKTGNWLTVPQAEALLATPPAARLAGKRDRALLATLIGCGLRRREAADLTLEQIQTREARWVILDIRGKGNRTRSVPMPSWCKLAIDVWATPAGITSGRIFRAINKGDKLAGDAMTTQSIFEALRKHAAAAGLGAIAPHDLRRTFAKLAHKGRAALEQIQLSLGHASIKTTERYLGVEQDLTDAPCDHLGLKVEKAQPEETDATQN